VHNRLSWHTVVNTISPHCHTQTFTCRYLQTLHTIDYLDKQLCNVPQQFLTDFCTYAYLAILAQYSFHCNHFSHYRYNLYTSVLVSTSTIVTRPLLRLRIRQVWRSSITRLRWLKNPILWDSYGTLKSFFSKTALTIRFRFSSRLPHVKLCVQNFFFPDRGPLRPLFGDM